MGLCPACLAYEKGGPSAVCRSCRTRCASRKGWSISPTEGATMRHITLALATGLGLLSASTVNAQQSATYTLTSPGPASAPVELKGRFEVLPYTGDTPRDQITMQ